jgi:hypothetical protein
MMNRAGILKPTHPWLAKFTSDYDGANRLIWSLRTEKSTDVFVASVRGRKMKQRQGVFDQFAASLQFPHYFGENWNAFSDCVRDLDWLRASAFVVVVLDAEDTLVEGDPDEFHLLLKILSDAGDEWSRADSFRPAKPFHTVLHTVPGQAMALHSRLVHLDVKAPELDHI